jgi:hypothetical protein
MTTAVFNDIEFIQNHIRYHYDLFDEMIYVDGAYQAFSHEHPMGWSTDGTAAVITHYIDDHDPENKIKLIYPREACWKTEMEKRTNYLARGMPGDWFFVVDSDEMVWGDLGRLRDFLANAPESLNVFSPAYVDYPREHLGGLPYSLDAFNLALIRWVPGVKYIFNHWTLAFPDLCQVTYTQQGRIVLGGPWWTDQPFFEKHVHIPWVGRKHFRRKDTLRIALKQAYYQIHHHQENIEPWKLSDEDWEQIALGEGEHIKELLARRQGWKDAQKGLKELGWD